MPHSILAINPETGEVFLDGRTVFLTSSQRTFVCCLARAKQPVPERDLMDALWGKGRGNELALRQVASRTRKRIRDNPDQPKWLFRAKRIGYQLRNFSAVENEAIA